MSLQNLVGEGLWMPLFYNMAIGAMSLASVDTCLLDADEEEVQFIGQIHIDGGGSKTFGTSGSAVDWLPGASITFAVNSTLTVGVKKASQISTSAGPPARATIGAAAFDVYKALIGGTDTITSTTWRSDAMASGSGFTVNDGDLIAVCFHLDTTAGTPSIKVRTGNVSTGFNTPEITLVTAGPTYAQVTAASNFILTFDDGTLGWMKGCFVRSSFETASGSIGNGNVNGNVFQVPFSCKIDALAACINVGSGSADFNFELYSDPLGTPTLVESVARDANQMGTSASARLAFAQLTTPRTLTINTDYAMGIKQTTANAITVQQFDVNATSHLKPAGLGAGCYAAISTAGAAFAAQNSGKRRYLIWAHVCALDDGVSAGGNPFGGSCF